MEFIKRLFCKHGSMEIVQDYTWITLFMAETSTNELRKYLICKKCGYKRKITAK